MYIDRWQWFRDFERQAFQNNDTQRLQLVQTNNRGWRLLNTARFAEAKAEFKKGAQLARQLNEPWWEVLLEYATCYMGQQQYTYQEMLECAVKLVSRMTRPDLQAHPYRATIHDLLIRAYAEIDICGYQAEIRAAMVFIEENIPLDKYTHLSIYYWRTRLALFFEEYDKAYHNCLLYQRLAIDVRNFARQSNAHWLLSEYYFATGDVIQSLEATRQWATHARSAGLLWREGMALGGQSIRLAWLGRDGEAYQQYSLAKSHLEALGRQDLLPSLTTRYLGACGQDAAALEHSAKALEIAQQTGSLDKIMSWHRTRSYLLNRLKQPLDAELAAAHALLKQFRTPDCHHKKLEQIAQGRCYAYDWQIKQRQG